MGFAYRVDHICVGVEEWGMEAERETLTGHQHRTPAERCARKGHARLGRGLRIKELYFKLPSYSKR